MCLLEASILISICFRLYFQLVAIADGGESGLVTVRCAPTSDPTSDTCATLHTCYAAPTSDPTSATLHRAPGTRLLINWVLLLVPCYAATSTTF